MRACWPECEAEGDEAEGDEAEDAPEPNIEEADNTDDSEETLGSER